MQRSQQERLFLRITANEMQKEDQISNDYRLGHN